MTDEKLNRMLQQALSSEVPTEYLNRNLKHKMEEKVMKKKFSVKKALVMAAVCCLLVGTVCVASTGVTSYIVSSSGVDVYMDFTELEQAEKKAGFQVKARENFSNGYIFDSIDVGEAQDMDENGNVLAKYKEISFTYKKGDAEIFINALREKNAQESATRKPDAKKEIESIDVKYFVDAYKFVPVDYEMTEEDKANVERENYFISSGVDEIMETKVSYVVWVQEGIRYSIMAHQELPKELLFEMAEELIMTEGE